MKHINVITCTQIREFPEWDKDRFPENEYDFQYNSEEDRVWDSIVIRQNLPYPMKFKCKKSGVVFTNCEPPSAWPLPHSFTSQFDLVLVQNPKVKHPNKMSHHGFLSWTIGRSYKTKMNKYFYKDLAHLEPQKTKSISIVTSNLMAMSGHVKRTELINRLMNDFPGQIDRFGRGYQFVDVKGDALLPYRFHICMENSSFLDYWTEKFADPILAQSVPVYAGCPNIDAYFGKDGYIKFEIDNYEGLKKIVQKILNDPEGEYQKYKSGLEKLRKTLMEKENLIPFIIDYLNNHPGGQALNYELTPMENCAGFKFLYNILRVKRLLFKIYFNLFLKNKIK